MRKEMWHPFRSTRAASKEARPGPGHVKLADAVHGHPQDVQTEFVTDWDDLSGVEVVSGEFVTTTADGSSNTFFEPITGLLQQVRERTGMDVVFVAQFVNGKRLVRNVASAPGDRCAVFAGQADPLEATYCQRVLDGRLPPTLADARDNPEAARLPMTSRSDIRAHLIAPIVTRDGRVFGTVCAYAHQPRMKLDEPLAVLKSVARALARALEQA
jgi:GAF domain-containing protein